MNDVEAAWVAGILEGEGTFHLKAGATPVVKCGMTDQDVIGRG